MGLLNFHIFDSAGNCLFSLTPPDKVDQTKILYGFLYSLKSFTGRVSPAINRDNSYFQYSTSHYHLVFIEFATSIKFVLIVSADVKKDSDSYRELLTQVYRRIYVEYFVKNPVLEVLGPIESTVNSQLPQQQQDQQQHQISSTLFRNQLIQFLSNNNLM